MKNSKTKFTKTKDILNTQEKANERKHKRKWKKESRKERKRKQVREEENVKYSGQKLQ